MSNMEPQPKLMKLREDHDVKEVQTLRCAHWVIRKKRFCKLTVSEGQTFCGEHTPALANADAANKDRVICPLDPRHTVYKNKLQKHLKICNARQSENDPSYIKRGVNCGQAVNGTTVHSNLKLSELSDDEFYSVIKKVRKLYNEFAKNIIVHSEVQSDCLDMELSRTDLGAESKKHLQQSAALLGILDNEGQLQESTTYLEFGAGKGQLAFYLAALVQNKQLTNDQVILVDRMSLRHKKDNKVEDRSLVRRLRADIADFNLQGLEILKDTRRLVAVSKHLCGGATDLTLRCITQSSTVPVEFVLIALCCHHRCDWQSFVGKEFFQVHEVTEREFAIITKMVGWAVCGTGMSRELRKALEQQPPNSSSINDNATNHIKQRLDRETREEVGMMCKRLLDYSRIGFLEKNGYTVQLKYYVPNSVTLENVCLIARKI